MFQNVSVRDANPGGQCRKGQLIKCAAARSSLTALDSTVTGCGSRCTRSSCTWATASYICISGARGVAGMQLARHYLAQDSGQLFYGVGLVQEFKARAPVLRQDMAVA